MWARWLLQRDPSWPCPALPTRHSCKTRGTWPPGASSHHPIHQTLDSLSKQTQACFKGLYEPLPWVHPYRGGTALSLRPEWLVANGRVFVSQGYDGIWGVGWGIPCSVEKNPVGKGERPWSWDGHLWQHTVAQTRVRILNLNMASQDTVSREENCTYWSTP